MPQAPTISAHSVEMTMKKMWKLFSDTSHRRRFDNREHGKEQDEDEERDGQEEDRVDDLALVEEVHEHRRHHPRLDAGDHERNRDGERPVEAQVAHSDGDGGQAQQGDEHHVVLAQVLLELLGALRMRKPVASARRGQSPLLPLMRSRQRFAPQRRYSEGKRKIQTRSTKCQYRPAFSTRLVKRSGSVAHIRDPTVSRNVLTMMPPMTWMPCRPVSVKYTA